jgi:ornithine carbamoyltransferase
MFFEKPSLRTRLSFEAGMTQLGGHAIYYSIRDSPLGVKENLSDTVHCASRFVDIAMARVNTHETIEGLAEAASVPTINALDDRCHPCQVLADALTVREVFGQEAADPAAPRRKLAFYGDGENNMAYALLRLGAILGWDVTVSCPEDPRYAPRGDVFEQIVGSAQARASGATLAIDHSAERAAEGADVVYTDSWLSYGTPDAERDERMAAFGPYRVTQRIMDAAGGNAVFMNCLPADRTAEQDADVIDGPRSIVFDQAENRLHAQKALMVYLLQGEAILEKHAIKV